MPAAWWSRRSGTSRRTGLGETGRRELRHILRTVEMSLVGLALPTRRPFDTTDQLDERMRRADAAFAMAYELGTKIVLARAGAVPPPEDAGTPGSVHATRCSSWAGAPSTTASSWRWKPARIRVRSSSRFWMRWARRAWPPASTPAASCKRGSTRSPPCASWRHGSCMPMPKMRRARPVFPRSIREALAFLPGPSIGKSTWVRSRRSATAAFLTVWPVPGPSRRGPVHGRARAALKQAQS